MTKFFWIPQIYSKRDLDLNIEVSYVLITCCRVDHTYLNLVDFSLKLHEISFKLSCLWCQDVIPLPFQIHRCSVELSGYGVNAFNIWFFKRFKRFEQCNYLFDLKKQKVCCYTAESYNKLNNTHFKIMKIHFQVSHKIL